MLLRCPQSRSCFQDANNVQCTKRSERDKEAATAASAVGGAPALKIVPIQKLPKARDDCGHAHVPDVKQHWFRKACGHWSEACKCNVLCYVENGKADLTLQGNSFYDAFVAAYNTHGDVVLSPDDVWLVICMQFSKYIDHHAEEMRHMFVEHTGQKALSVTTGKDLEESQWDEFLTRMPEEIAKNTKGDIVSKLSANFSTSGRVERLLSAATIMDSFKAYFKYGRADVIPCCGIANVQFMGTLDDWNNLLERAKALAKYDVDGGWTN